MPPKGRAKPASPRSGGGGIVERLKSYYGFMQEQGLELLEVEEGDFRLKMSRRRERIPVPVFQSGPAAEASPSQTPAAPSKPAAPAVSGETVKSPMMGIFYRAPSPSSPPYAKDGQAVRAGDIICMIEAMKVFNEIKADFDCTVTRALVENGKPVKLGQDLFIVKRG